MLVHAHSLAMRNIFHSDFSARIIWVMIVRSNLKFSCSFRECKFRVFFHTIRIWGFSYPNEYARTRYKQCERTHPNIVIYHMYAIVKTWHTDDTIGTHLNPSYHWNEVCTCVFLYASLPLKPIYRWLPIICTFEWAVKEPMLATAWPHFIFNIQHRCTIPDRYPA